MKNRPTEEECDDMKIFEVVSALLVIVAATSGVLITNAQKPGPSPKSETTICYSAVNTNDPGIKAAAEFVAAEQGRREGVDLSLMEIVQAQKQIVSGLNYKMCLRVKSGSTTRTAVAVIYKNLQQQYSLTSFQWGKCVM
jgi:Aspartic acid proteinase inhibitor